MRLGHFAVAGAALVIQSPGVAGLAQAQPAPVLRWIADLKSPDPAVRRAAARLVDAPVCLASAEEDVFPFALAMAESLSDPSLRVFADWNLRVLGPRARVRARPVLLGLLEHADKATRLSALEILTREGDGDDDDETASAAEVLLRSPRAEVRCAAIELLAVAHSSKVDATGALRSVLKDPTAVVRCAAISGLVRRGAGAASAAAELLEVLRNDPGGDELRGDQVRARAASALGRIGAQPGLVLPALITALASDSWEMRDGALRGIEGLGPAAVSARPLVHDMRRDSDPRVRKTAREAEAALKPKRKSAPNPYEESLTRLMAFSGVCADPPPGFPAQGVFGSAPLLNATADGLVAGAGFSSDDMVAEPGVVWSYRGPAWTYEFHQFQDVMGQRGQVPFAWAGGQLWAGAVRWAGGERPGPSWSSCALTPAGKTIPLDVPAGGGLQLAGLDDGGVVAAISDRSAKRTRFVRLRSDGTNTSWLEIPAVVIHLSQASGRVIATTADGRILELAADGRSQVLFEDPPRPWRDSPNSAVALAGNALAVGYSNRVVKVVNQRAVQTLLAFPALTTRVSHRMSIHSADATGKTLAASVWFGNGYTGQYRVRLMRCP